MYIHINIYIGGEYDGDVREYTSNMRSYWINNENHQYEYNNMPGNEKYSSYGYYSGDNDSDVSYGCDVDGRSGGTSYSYKGETEGEVSLNYPKNKVCDENVMDTWQAGGKSSVLMQSDMGEHTDITMGMHLGGHEVNSRQWSEKVREVLGEANEKFDVSQAEQRAAAATQSDITTQCNTWCSHDDDMLDRMDGSIEKVLEGLRSQYDHLRFNGDRCKRVFKEDIEYERLYRLATVGAEVDVGSDFQQVQEPEPLRPIQLRIPRVFEQHAVKLRIEHKVLLFSKNKVMNKGLHFSPAHWTAEVAKPLGRFLIDASNSAQDGGHINSDDGLEGSKTRYGKLVLPSIRDIIRMIYSCAEEWKVGSISDLSLWKEDISGAFNRFWMASESSKQFATMISPTIVMIYATGCFGWNAAPLVWGVLMRALVNKIRESIGHQHVCMYVDDTIGVSRDQESGMRDQIIARNVMVDALGPDAVNKAKSTPPAKELDIVGWKIDLVRETMSLTEKALMKLAYVFFNLKEDEKISVVTYQKIASLAQRYSEGIVGMRPFVAPFWEMIRMLNKYKHACMSKVALFSINTWRQVLTLMIEGPPEKWAVKLRNFRNHQNAEDTLILITDASPAGVGIVLTTKQGVVMYHASYKFPWVTEAEAKQGKGRQLSQNLREFLGIMVGLIMVWKVKEHKEVITIVLDNTTALSWVGGTIAKGNWSIQKAYFAFIMVNLIIQPTIKSTRHIHGIEMGVVDDLSRFKKTTEVKKLEGEKNRNKVFPLELDELCLIIIREEGVQKAYERIRIVVNSMLYSSSNPT